MNKTHEDQKFEDAWTGKNEEGYYRLQASMYPDPQPKRYSYGPPPAVTEQPRYKALHSEVCAKQLKALSYTKILEDVGGTRRYWLKRVKGETMFKDCDELRALYAELAAAVGAKLAKVATKKHKLETDVAVCREQMAAIEREYYQSRPEIYGNPEGGHL